MQSLSKIERDNNRVLRARELLELGGEGGEMGEGGMIANSNKVRGFEQGRNVRN
jgi:hypothetical protein